MVDYGYVCSYLIGLWGMRGYCVIVLLAYRRGGFLGQLGNFGNLGYHTYPIFPYFMVINRFGAS
jgi:hypothetical protein